MTWLCSVLMVPLMLFICALETKRTRINRFRSYGWSWKRIAHIYIRSLMHADGNIQYANYQSLDQMTNYLTGHGYADTVALIA